MCHPVCGQFQAITRLSPLEGSDVSLRILTLILLTTAMTFVAGFAGSSASTSHPTGCTPTPSLRPLHLDVPANRAVTFPLAELVPGVDESVATWQQPDTGNAEGLLRVTAASEATGGSARLTAEGLVFEPAPGFVGASTGWILAPDQYVAAEPVPQACATGSDLPAGALLVTFEVRNTLPVAIADAVVVPNVVRTVDVGPESGVLANDLDWNGDQLVVHAAGVAEFPWGSVQLAADGSYRITVTDRDLLAPSTVRYLVWDQQGSPTSIDTGYLEIDFSAN